MATTTTDCGDYAWYVVITFSFCSTYIGVFAMGCIASVLRKPAMDTLSDERSSPPTFVRKRAQHRPNTNGVHVNVPSRNGGVSFSGPDWVAREFCARGLSTADNLV